MSGFFGCVSKNDAVPDVFYGTDYHSHLGTRRGGLAFYDAEAGFQRSIHNIENSYFRNKFETNILEFKGNSGIGVISDYEAQPIVVNSHLGKFALAHVGRILNAEELEADFLHRHRHFSETSGNGVNPTELIAMLICEGQDLLSGIQHALRSVKGSSSLLILTDEGIIAARDKFGRTPIIIGKSPDAYAASFETCAFSNLNYEITRYLGPGEIGMITATEYRQLAAPGDQMQICAFLWVYYGYPPSYYENINVESCRYRCGAALAKDDVVEAEFVAGVPDSGVGSGLGYSNEKKLPFTRPYTKYTPTWPRSFTPTTQEQRDLVAKMKLIPNPDLIEGKSGVFLDDSIVRGTQLKDNTNDLHQAGIREIHMRIACPPLLYPCEYLNFSRSRNSLELATRKAVMELEGTENADFTKYLDPESEDYRKMVDVMREKLGLTTLKFQKMDDLVEAIGLPKEKLCTHCFDGTGLF